MSEINDILAALASAPLETAALATLVAVEGSSYRRPGARLLMLSDGHRIGSISGGCLEDNILLRARAVLQSGRPEIAVYDTTSENDIVWGVGLGCRGVVRVFIEKIPVPRPKWISELAVNQSADRATPLAVVHDARFSAGRETCIASDLPLPAAELEVFREIIAPPPALFIFGAGDDARPLVRLAKAVGWRVTVIDSRSAYATAVRFPEADKKVVATMEEAIGSLAFDEKSYVVIMTHRFAEDEKILRGLLARSVAYLGILGPRSRTDRLLLQLERDGWMARPEMLENLYAPVGLDLGSAAPETIALSILAELQCCLTGRTPIHLRDRAAPIHG